MSKLGYRKDKVRDRLLWTNLSMWSQRVENLMAHNQMRDFTGYFLRFVRI